MSEWKTIDSAPKDGSDVLVYTPMYQEQFIAYHLDGEWIYSYSVDANGADIYITCAPSHWMPLPEPPTILSKAEKV